MAEVAALLEQETAKAPKEIFYSRIPLFLLRIISKPYPDRYEPHLDRYKLWTFAQNDGRRESAIEHVSKFIDILGPYAADEDLCL